jgi:gamma-glutamylcyclotransferase (GGCT)/AIG2-like uncharacterized protein YtfP
MSEYLFAYGTLRPGCAPVQVATLAAKLRPAGDGWIHGRLYDLGGYPGAVPDASAERKIFGTVIELPDDPDFLRRLDAYEECDPFAPDTSEYVRVLIEVELAGGGTVECWFYRYNWDVGEKRQIRSGDWKDSCQ